MADLNLYKSKTALLIADFAIGIGENPIAHHSQAPHQRLLR